jgi:hypothetical protein
MLNTLARLIKSVPNAIAGDEIEQWIQSHATINGIEKALIGVRIQPIDKGVPKRAGILYLLETQSEYDSWSAKTDTFGESPHRLLPKIAMGFISVGGFSFQNGRGDGLGFCRAIDVIKMAAIAQQQKRTDPLLAVMRLPTWQNGRPCHIHIMQ